MNPPSHPADDLVLTAPPRRLFLGECARLPLPPPDATDALIVRLMGRVIHVFPACRCAVTDRLGPAAGTEHSRWQGVLDDGTGTLNVLVDDLGGETVPVSGDLVEVTGSLGRWDSVEGAAPWCLVRDGSLSNLSATHRKIPREAMVQETLRAVQIIRGRRGVDIAGVTKGRSHYGFIGFFSSENQERMAVASSTSSLPCSPAPSSSSSALLMQTTMTDNVLTLISDAPSGIGEATLVEHLGLIYKKGEHGDAGNDERKRLLLRKVLQDLQTQGMIYLNATKKSLPL